MRQKLSDSVEARQSLIRKRPPNKPHYVVVLTLQYTIVMTPKGIRHSIEIDSRIAAFGEQNLQRNQISNVKVEVGAGHAGWGTAEYDAILLTGSTPAVPDALKYQLCIGGRMVVVVGQGPVMTAYRITRTSAASFDTVGLFDTVIKPLRGTAVSKFKF